MSQMPLYPVELSNLNRDRAVFGEKGMVGIDLGLYWANSSFKVLGKTYTHYYTRKKELNMTRSNITTPYESPVSMSSFIVLQERGMVIV